VRTDFDGTGPPVRVATPDGHRWYRSRWTATITDDTRTVRLDFTTTDDGPSLTSATVTPRGPSTPVDDVWPSRSQLRDMADRAAQMAGSVWPIDRWQSMIVTDVAGAAELAGRPVTPGRRTTITDDLLREVAAMYRDAVAAGFAPRPYIAGLMHRSTSTVAAWVQHARSRFDPLTGRPFLGPARSRQAGEITEEENER
jgi:hypothetical protein